MVKRRKNHNKKEKSRKYIYFDEEDCNSTKLAGAIKYVSVNFVHLSFLLLPRHHAVITLCSHFSLMTFLGCKKWINPLRSNVALGQEKGKSDAAFATRSLVSNADLKAACALIELV